MMLSRPENMHQMVRQGCQLSLAITKLSDAQINHFLYFLQYGGVMQDDASETRSVKLSTGRRATTLNAVRTVHKAEIIRLYTSACDKEGYTKEKELCGTSSTTAQHQREKV